MLTYLFIGSVALTGVALFNNVYTLNNRDTVIREYLDIYNSLPDKEKNKYNQVPGRLILLNLRSVQNATVDMVKLYPDFFNVLSLPNKASVTISAATKVFQYIQSEKYNKDLDAIDKELKAIGKDLKDKKND